MAYYVEISNPIGKLDLPITIHYSLLSILLSQGDGVVVGEGGLADAGADVLVHEGAGQIGHVHLNGRDDGCVLVDDLFGPGVFLVGIQKLGVVVLVAGQCGQQLVVAVEEVLVAAVFHDDLVEGQFHSLQRFLIAGQEGALVVGSIVFQCADDP